MDRRFSLPYGLARASPLTMRNIRAIEDQGIPTQSVASPTRDCGCCCREAGVQHSVVDPILLDRDERIKTPVTFEAANSLRSRILTERDTDQWPCRCSDDYHLKQEDWKLNRACWSCRDEGTYNATCCEGTAYYLNNHEQP